MKGDLELGAASPWMFLPVVTFQLSYHLPLSANASILRLGADGNRAI